MKRRAVLVFAHSAGFDLSRRRLPRALQPLLALPALEPAGINADFHFFTSAKRNATRNDFHFHAQRGASFGARLEAATEELCRLGYEEIVVIGSDCPSLQNSDITAAFVALAEKRLVLGPDHRGGCYLIAFRANDRHLLRGIRWNCDRDRAQLQDRVNAAACELLATKVDVDSWADLRRLARAGHSLAHFVLRAFQLPRKDAFLVDRSAQFLRERGQMPPPAFAR